MKAVGYVRVSTGRQAERGASLDAQKREISGWVAARGWLLADLAVDAASGRSMDGRPGLGRALAQLDAGEFEALVVTKLDRLSRSALDFATLMERAERHDWSIVLLDGAADTSTPQGETMAHVQAAFAQLERRMISQRILDAIEERKEQGIYRGGRLTPQGAPLAGPAVARITSLARESCSLQEIARRLELEDVPTARGGRWTATTVRRVLAREGVMCRGGTSEAA